MSSADHVLVFKWTPRVDGDSYFVDEHIGEQHVAQFGPLPRDMVGPFVDERREYVTALAKRYIFAVSERWQRSPS
jgi:hypothetical protein